MTEERIKKLENDVDNIRSLLQKVLNPEGKIELNMTIEEMLVNIKGKSHVERSVDTGTVPGRVMFCALKDFPRDKLWSQSEMLKALDERGWHTSSGTLSTTVSRLVSDGLLVSKEREGYRAPSKVTFTGDEL
jgi:hypothetical protein